MVAFVRLSILVLDLIITNQILLGLMVRETSAWKVYCCCEVFDGFAWNDAGTRLLFIE